MKIVVKSIEDRAGHANTAWLAVGGDFSTISGKGSLVLQGFKDPQAIVDLKTPADTQTVVIDLMGDANIAAGFETLWTAIATWLVANPASPYYGGSIQDVEPA